jgi:glycolate oxidase FAD binding subunit
MLTLQPKDVAEVQDLVQSSPCLRAAGGGTKTGLAGGAPEAVRVDFTALQGVLEYEPEEYTFTALAGTRVAAVDAMLGEHGQYLPFDPPFAARGATLGGTVAAGLSGSGRYRFGGVRDFLLAIQFVDGQGRLARSGGKVVKNAAGFDLSKFMVGSLGEYGLLTELTFKVFPRPAQYATLRVSFPTVVEALAGLQKLAGLSLDLYALDLIPEAAGTSLLARIGGLAEAFPARLERLQGLAGRGEVLEAGPEAELWRQAGEFEWLPAGNLLVKVPLTPGRLPALDGRLAQDGAVRRYAAGANLAWVGWPGEPAELDALLGSLDMEGLVVLGPAGRPRLGRRSGQSFAQRIKKALDPQGKFGG